MITIDSGDNVEDVGTVASVMEVTYSFTASKEAFFGMISSINGSKPGYVSSSFWRRPRCTEDFTLERLLGGILRKDVSALSFKINPAIMWICFNPCPKVWIELSREAVSECC